MLEMAVAEPAGPPTLEEIDRLRLSGSRPLTQKVLATVGKGSLTIPEDLKQEWNVVLFYRGHW